MKTYRALFVATIVLVCTGLARSQEEDQSPTPPPGSSSIQGCVRDADGAPIANAAIEAGLAVLDGTLKHSTLTAATDANGVYTFSNLPSWTVTLSVSAEGYSALRRKSITLSDNQRLAGIDFILKPALTISGRVADSSGQPIQGAELTAVPESEKKLPKPLVSQDAVTAQSGEDGHYTITSLNAGNYTVNARSEQYVPGEAAHVAAGSQHVDFALKGGGGLSGTVRDKTSGKPVPGAGVSIEAEQGPLREELIGSYKFGSKTDNSGSYNISSMDTGSYRLKVTAKGYTEASRSGVGVRAGEETKGIDFSLTPNSRIRGTVTFEGGEPAAGAALLLRSAIGIPVIMGGTFGRSDAIADARGRYEIIKGEAGKQYSVQASLAGYVTSLSQSFQLVPGRDQEDVNLVLKKGLSLSGKVVDEKQNPISGAKVSARKEGGGTFVMDFSQNVPVGKGQEAALTDNEGAFVLDGLEAGMYKIKATAKGYSQSEVGGIRLSSGTAPEPLKIVLQAGITISGRVGDGSGNPLQGAKVRASGRGEGGHISRSAETDEDGRYEIDSLSSGSYKVRTQLKGYAQKEIEDVSPPAKDINFTLSDAGSITGRVVEKETAKPIPRFRYRANKGHASDRALFTFHGKERYSEEGTFETEPLSPDDYSLFVRAEGYAPSMTEGIEVKSGETARVEIKLGPPATIAGKVSSEKGLTPVSGARIALLKEREEEIFTFGFGFDDRDLLGEPVLSDDTGAFRIYGLPVGKFRLKVAHPDFAEETKPVELAKEGETVRVEFILKKGRTISGTVRDGATSSPIAGAVVTISSGKGTGGILEKMIPSMGRKGPGSATSDAAGKWNIANIAPGDYRLLAVHKDYAAPESKSVTVKPDADASGVELVLSGGARVHGTVKDAGGKAVSGARVTAVSENGMARATTDSDGRYALEHLAPGDWMVSVSSGEGAGGDADMTRPVSVAAGDDRALDFTLGGGFSVSGRVISHGAPLAGAYIYFSREEAGEQVSTHGESRKDGSYRVTGFSAGSYEVRVLKGDEGDMKFCDLPARLAVSGDLTGQDIVLPSGVIAGTLADEEGKTLAGVRVRLVKKDEGKTKSAESEIEKQMRELLSLKKSGKGGAFEFAMLGAGNYVLAAEKKGIGRASVTAALASDDGRAEVALTMRPGFPMKLRAVSAASGKPLERAAVRVTDKNGDEVKEETVSAERGVLTVPDLAAGTYRVEVAAEGYAPGKLDAVKVGPEEESATELKLEKGATLTVTVAREKNGPVAGAVVELLDSSGKRYNPPSLSKGFMLGGRTVTGSQGKAKFDRLPEGAFTVKASKAGCTPAEANVTLKKGEDVKISLIQE